MNVEKQARPSVGRQKSRAHAGAKEALSNLQIRRSDSPTFQLAELIRGMIEAEELRPGMRLPSTRELSEQLNVDASSVHRALKKLVKEGRLTRTPYVGTFVADPPSEKLERLAYYFHSPQGHIFNEFGRALLEQVNLLAHRKGISLEVISDTRSEAEQQASAPEELIRMARTRQIQGVLTSSTSPERTPWLDSLPIPYATISNPALAHAFNWNRKKLASMAINQLIKRGCQQPATLTTTSGSPVPRADAYQMGIYNGHKEAIEAANLAFNPERMIGLAPECVISTSNGFAEFGFQAFQQLWEDLPSEERPDGLFIYPDSLLPGVLLAASSRGLKIGEDIQLVVYSNEEIPLFCPYPIDQTCVRVADAAEALVQHIENELKNRATKSQILPASLICYT